MSRSVIRPEHLAQLHELRKWARKQGKTPTAPIVVPTERLSDEEIEKRDRATVDRLTKILGPPDKTLKISPDGGTSE